MFLRLDPYDDGARLRGQRPEPPPKPRGCALCGFRPDADGYYMRPGDDRKMHKVGDELICSLCVTPADTGSRRYARPAERGSIRAADPAARRVSAAEPGSCGLVPAAD